MRSLHDHARVIGSDATTFIIIPMCRSTSRHCLTIRMSYSACCGRWCLSIIMMMNVVASLPMTLA
jgi:hypothetical protein